mmetsp:Transcript_42689/g.95852  ORF Transcript_42689/g.95852 Transcript_42689/m.95852 type:complete len:103 (-) Transcript_42689:454-762(-)
MLKSWVMSATSAGSGFQLLRPTQLVPGIRARRPARDEHFHQTDVFRSIFGAEECTSGFLCPRRSVLQLQPLLPQQVPQWILAINGWVHKQTDCRCRRLLPRT